MQQLKSRQGGGQPVPKKPAPQKPAPQQSGQQKQSAAGGGISIKTLLKLLGVTGLGAGVTGYGFGQHHGRQAEQTKVRKVLKGLMGDD